MDPRGCMGVCANLMFLNEKNYGLGFGFIISIILAFIFEIIFLFFSSKFLNTFAEKNELISHAIGCVEIFTRHSISSFIRKRNWNESWVLKISKYMVFANPFKVKLGEESGKYYMYYFVFATCFTITTVLCYLWLIHWPDQG